MTQSPASTALNQPITLAPRREIQFGLMFFASGEQSLGADKYRLVLESAQYADRQGFSSIWIPERHFTQLGCLYPNPAVLHAALARETQRVRLQAGSVVLPLHDPIRVAEEWAMVDNLSGGRVGVSFASGWNPQDFVLAPDRYSNRHQDLLQAMQTVQSLWQGESISRTAGNAQPASVRIYPTPVQTSLPIWVTAASNPNTFIQAGESGANLLTHLFDQEVDALAQKLDLYRSARAACGFDPHGGEITVALHTFVGEALDVVREQVRQPYCSYLKSHIHLLQGLSYSRGFDIQVDALSKADLDSLAVRVFEKFFSDRRALLGTPESCLGLVEQLQQIGITELACLLDFGPDPDLILANLPHLDRLRRACQTESAPLPIENRRATKGQPPAIADIQARCQPLSGAEFYQQLQHQGVELGESFQGIERLWRRDGEALGRVRLPASLSEPGYDTHPAFLDACLQVFFACLPLMENRRQYLPVGLGQLQVYAPLSARLWSHAQLTSPLVAAPHYEGNVRIFDRDGQQLLMEVTGIRLQQAFVDSSVPTKSADNWFYTVDWQPCQRQEPTSRTKDSASLLDPDVIGDRTRAYAAQPSMQQQWEDYRAFLPQLEALSAEYVLHALQQLGGIAQPGAVTTADLLHRFQVVDSHQRLFKRLLRIGSEVGALQASGDEWSVKRPFVSDPETTFSRLKAQYPDYAPQLELLHRCGQVLADVLQGRCDPRQVLFPNGSFAAVERLYQDSPAANRVNQLVQYAITLALEHQPSDRPIRILEIGAGTGATTTSILPQLKSEHTEYVFTDISPLFVQKAEQKFAAYPFVEYRCLDIEQAPQAQGFAPQQFDLVLAANVLHATANLQQSLQHIQALLKSGGLLVLLEGTQPQRWLDLIFGLTEGWWRFTDLELRPDYPLLSALRWRSLLQAQHWAVDTVAIGHTDETQCSQAIVLAKTAKPAARHWLVLADRTGVAAALTPLFEQQGDRVTTLAGSEDVSALPALLSQSYHGLLYLWGLDAPVLNSIPDNWDAALATVTQLPLQLLQAVEHSQSAPIWWVTRGGQSVTASSSSSVALAQSLLWGLGKVFAVEQPHRRGGVVDLDPQASTTQAAAELLEAILTNSEMSAFRQGTQYTPRLLRHHQPPSKLEAFTQGSYLITGGLGDLGLLVAQWLAEQGVQQLILLGRSPLPPRATWTELPADSRKARQVAAIQALEERGVRVYLASADVSHREQIEQAIATVGEGGCPPVRGVFHLAGVPQGLKPLTQLAPSTLMNVLRPKVLGSWNLHQIFGGDLDCFVLFSSWASLLGPVGQQLGGYSMANAFLDSLAHYRSQLGQPALSINWGDWAEVGMRARHVRSGQQLLPEGWTLSPAEGLRSLEYLLASSVPPQMGVLPVPWSEFFQVFPQAAAQPFLEALRSPARTDPNTASTDRVWLEELHHLPFATRQSRLRQHVQAQVARVMGLPPSHLDCQRGLFELGMDSLMALELKNHLEASLGAVIPVAATFEHPSVNALSSYIAQEIFGWASAPAAETKAPSTPDEPLDRIAQLSDDEVERLFAEKSQSTPR
ncbi:MAG: MupA/Atu3671 family FMN-dependent luciferase-like monooxygenase [Cyanophyceae cyanobacterium]